MLLSDLTLGPGSKSECCGAQDVAILVHRLSQVSSHGKSLSRQTRKSSSGCNLITNDLFLLLRGQVCLEPYVTSL